MVILEIYTILFCRVYTFVLVFMVAYFPFMSMCSSSMMIVGSCSRVWLNARDGGNYKNMLRNLRRYL